MKFILILIMLSPFITKAQQKSAIDSVVMQFLQSKPLSEKPFFEVKKKGKYTVINKNYSWNVHETIDNKGVKIEGYTFGYSASHAERYYLIKIHRNGTDVYEIIDERNISKAIEKLLGVTASLGLSNSQNAMLIHQLTTAYF
jgi:hypothetical protein